MFVNLNYLLALPTLIANLASSCLQLGAVVQIRDFIMKRAKIKLQNTLPNQVNNIPFQTFLNYKEASFKTFRKSLGSRQLLQIPLD